MSTQKAIVSGINAARFIVAGKAKFTLIGAENRFTYNVIQPKFNKKPCETMRFVKTMDSKNGNKMTYIGLLKLNPHTKKWDFDFRVPTMIQNSRLNPSFTTESLEVKAFKYAIKVYQRPGYEKARQLMEEHHINEENALIIMKEKYDFEEPQMEMWHEGKCACCARPLTVPEAIQLGWGYHCFKRLKEKELASETQEQFEAR